MTDVITITNTVTNQVKVIEQAPTEVVTIVQDASTEVLSVVTQGPQGAPYASAAAQAATEAARDEAVAAAVDAVAAKTDLYNRITYGSAPPSGGSNGDIYFKIV